MFCQGRNSIPILSTHNKYTVRAYIEKDNHSSARQTFSSIVISVVFCKNYIVYRNVSRQISRITLSIKRKNIMTIIMTCTLCRAPILQFQAMKKVNKSIKTIKIILLIISVKNVSLFLSAKNQFARIVVAFINLLSNRTLPDQIFHIRESTNSQQSKNVTVEKSKKRI